MNKPLLIKPTKQFNTCLKTLLLLILIHQIQFSVKAQYENMSFEHLTLKDGISQITINSMLQDSYGFVWFATQDGLNRYDGVENKIYRPVLENPEASIAGSFINYIFEDANNDIWIATFTGLSKYDRDEDRFYNYYHNPNDTNTISDNIVFFVANDSYNNIWVATVKGLDKLILPKNETDSLKVIRYSGEHPFLQKLQSLSGWTMDAAGNIWLSSRRKGLFRIKREEQLNESPNIEQYNYEVGKENSLPSDRLIGLTSDIHGDIWVYSDQVLTKVVTKGEEVSFVNHRVAEDIPANINAFSFFLDGAGNVMFSAKNEGFYVYNIEKKELYNYKNEIYNPRSLLNNNVTKIMKDNSGVLWIGTSHGISRYIPDKNKFKHFEPQPNNPNWLRDYLVFSICVDKKGEYWIGTNNGNGIYVYSPKEKKFRNYSANRKDKSSLQDNSVFALLKDCEENMWIGSNNGLSKFDYNTNTFATYKSILGDENSLSNNIVRCIIENGKDELWIGTAHGLNVFNKRTKKFKRWQIDTINNTIDNNIQALLFDKKGNLWIGTFLGGLYKMVFESGSKAKFTHYKADKHDTTSISSNQVSSLLEDDKGNIWIATYGGGINKLNPITNQFELFTTKDGLPGNNFYGLLMDNNSNIWFSSSAGLTMYNIKTKTFTNYNINDGLQSNEFNGAACYKDENGMLYFGGINGFNIFNPDEIKDNLKVPEIVFTDFKIQNKSVLPAEKSPLKKSIQTTKQIELSHTHKDLRFEFAALHYVSPSQNQFAYMMEGYDDDWIDIGTQNYISFKSFPHGEYTLRIKAANCDGVWNEKGIAIKIIINPPFWATWWFRGVMIIVLIVFIWLYTIIRTRKLLKDKIKLKKIVERRTLEITEKNEELKQQSEELKSQNEEITTQRDQLEVQHVAITDSILYAKRIQNAVLPRIDYIDEILSENFILLKPRNVVSGDFYWVRKINNYIVIAVADCTGHGVPGAIMSMLGMSFINETIQKKEITQTNEALNELRIQIKQALQQTGENGDTYDGMDMALCTIDTNTNILQYAGANNPFYLIRNGKFTEIKPDKMPVSFYPNEKPSFTNHEIQLYKGDAFYLFSDGFPDQFGGKKGFKYKTVNFQKLLMKNYNKPMQTQKTILEKELSDWMKGYEQTDDILVMGVRV